MKKLTLLFFLSIAIQAQTCQKPSKLSYFSPVVKDQCSHVEKLSTGLNIYSDVLTVGDYSSTKYYLSNQAFVNSGYHEANPILAPLLRHEPLGGLYTAGSVLLTNASSNWTERHHGNERFSQVVSFAVSALKTWVVIHNYQSYRNFEKSFGR
jgi:hypothetical protein